MFFFLSIFCFFFFFNDTATTEIYTLSLHDALPVSRFELCDPPNLQGPDCWITRSEEHTSELQSRGHLVCRLLLEKKKKQIQRHRNVKKTIKKKIKKTANINS